MEAITEDMQKIFLVVEKYFAIWEEKKFIRKIPADDIVFELKNFSYIKAFFSNIKVRAHSFAPDIVQNIVNIVENINVEENKHES